MTRKDRLQAFEMRLEGKTWEEIGAALGYTANGVRLDILQCIKYAPRQAACVYPALRKYIVDHCDGSVLQFARQSGIPYSTLSNIVNGRFTPSKQTAAAILKETGLTFEEAFRLEEYT